ncbi:sensor domain-containing diguanylate cyclase [Actinomycetospora termitidis]|uniref:GGDEF domain-containing protein n=1 Tax=Actinomycetospora termitidis TaxID=3053470 RepID=A0ABT7MFZ9_9PSEU|nr:GGDEF domain-containing protein [Actinomycetospora sp. Odt1-22]MDL5158807.1 GGDEF domain-containing protein [Actinomycetospora sp. Odt1-22]
MTDSRSRLPSPDVASATVRDRGRRWSPRRWTLWSLPRSALAYVLGVEAAAVLVMVLTLVLGPHGRGWVVAGLLFLGAVTHAEAARHIERVRVSRVDRPFIDLKSMWTFAGLLLVPTGTALVLVGATFAYWWLRNGQHHSALHKWIFSWATVVLGTAAAGLVLQGFDIDTLLARAAGPTGLVLIAAAACVRWAVNHGLVVGILLLTTRDRSVRRHLASPADTLLGLGALALGAALAVLAAASPWLVPILLVPVITLHRGVLLDQFRHAARTDPKTGLANGAAWAEVAGKEIARARRHGIGLAVLMVDLDEFKAVNDAHGHLVGDEVLRAVAAALSAEVRAYDAVGRFGGEEFVVLLSGVDPPAATHAAERLRARIGAIDLTVPGMAGVTSRVRGLTASIGCVPCRPTDTTVEELLTAADAALYRAKRAGRDRTVTADPARPEVGP